MGIFEVADISKSFWRRSILNDIRFTIHSDKITALVGPNGAGKTTLIKIILGLEKADSGKIIFDNINIDKLPTHKRILAGLGYMAQQSSAITDLNVEDNLFLVPKLMPDDETYRESLLQEFNLVHVRKQKAKTLSGGELHKLEFCLCMVTRPQLIFLDEPFSGLDPKSTKLVTDMIKVQHKKGIGFVIVDHRIEELRDIAAEYILLGDQKIIFNGSREEFFGNELVKDRFLGT